MHTPMVEICNLLKFATSNKLVEQLMVLANDNVPGLVHPCPYTVR